MLYKYRGDDFQFERIHKDDEREILRVFVRIGVSINKITKDGVTTYKPYITPAEHLGEYDSLEGAAMALVRETKQELKEG